MKFENTLTFAKVQDEKDPLKACRAEFLIPQKNGHEITYLCGNSLGLQPKNTQKFIQEELNNWQNLGVEAWFEGDSPWLHSQKEIRELLAPIIGAQPSEVCAMNSLSVNLHLMMVSFYKPMPDQKKFKILMEAGAFPSDQYAVESQVRFHGLNPGEAIIEAHPRKGEYLLRTEDILALIQKHGDELSLVLFGGINYYTGQLFDMQKIAHAAHAVGAYAGFDLAHAAGNVPLQLHNWDVDFACWCSYKYMNSSPGGISGIFIHERHFNSKLNRFAGWWGYTEDERFKMEKGFKPSRGAEGWQLSCSPVLLLAAHKASLKLFEQVGGIEVLHAKSKLLTGYAEFLINETNRYLGFEQFRIISPTDVNERGCQLSLIAAGKGKQIFDELVKRHIIGDWREPDVIRVSPVPFYNTFEEVYSLGKNLVEICKALLQ